MRGWSSIVAWTLTALTAGLFLARLGTLLLESFFPLVVWRAELHGRVLDEKGRPVSGARVAAEFFGDRSADRIPGSRSPAITDADGVFALSTVPGAVTLFARRQGAGMSAPLDLEPRDGQEITGIELRLDPGGRITGAYTAADGAPLQGWWITIEQAGYRHWEDEARIASVRTGVDGRFECEHVPCGEIRVMLWSNSPTGPSAPFHEEKLVWVARGETTEVLFERPGRASETGFCQACPTSPDHRPSPYRGLPSTCARARTWAESQLPTPLLSGTIPLGGFEGLPNPPGRKYLP